MRAPGFGARIAKNLRFELQPQLLFADLHNPCNGGAQYGVDGKFDEEIHADHHDEQVVHRVRSVGKILQGRTKNG